MLVNDPCFVNRSLLNASFTGSQRCQFLMERGNQWRAWRMVWGCWQECGLVKFCLRNAT